MVRPQAEPDLTEARDLLVAELHQTVDAVVGELQSLAAGIAERARLLDEDVAEIAARSAAIAARAGELERELAGAGAGTGGRDPEDPEAEPADPDGESGDPEADPGDSRQPPSEVTLEDVEMTRASIRDAPHNTSVRLRRFARESEQGEIPEGVRMVIGQLRLAGRSDDEIASQLAEMGVQDPAALLARIEA